MVETPFFDAHTHHLPHDAQTTAILSCSMAEATSAAFPQAKFLSVSLHPWHLSTNNLQAQIEWMTHLLASDSRVVAIGEAGLDKLCDTPLPLQQEAFQAAIDLSEQYHLPLLIHAVKATTELLAFQKKHRPAQPWIIHGFRGKKELADDLLRHGFYLSFGKKYQEKALSAVPVERLLLESDEESINFQTFYSEVASVRGTTSESLIKALHENANHLFFNR